MTAQAEPTLAGDGSGQAHHQSNETIDWLRLPIPERWQGDGLDLRGLCRRLRELGRVTPWAAWPLVPHLAHLGAAARLHARGDHSLDWLLDAARDGTRIGAESTELGNDMRFLHAALSAEPVDGGYGLSGDILAEEAIASCQWLALRGIDLSRRGNPRIVHTMVAGHPLQGTRRVGRVRLDGVFVPDGHVLRIVSPGLAGADEWLLELLAWTTLGEAAVSAGAADRIIDLATRAALGRTSVALTRVTMAHHPGVQHAIAEMHVTVAGLEAHLDALATEEWSGADSALARGSALARMAALFVARDRAARAARRVAWLAIELAGTEGLEQGSALERFVHEATVGRAGRSDGFLARELTAKAALGLDADEQPRWG